VAYWDKFERPAINPKYTFEYLTWWVDPAKEAKIKSGKASLKSN
jgi:microcin C transport system substrate-binding protein